MILQLLLTFVGLFFPANNENKVSNNTTTIQLVHPANPDTGGETGPVLPPKK